MIMSAQPGKFITFEGGEGTGKTTQIQILGEALERAGHTVLRTREPGGSEGAEQIRTLLVQGGTDRWDAMCEALLLFAARRDHVRRTICPALKRGDWVICDRFTDSSLAYQGVAGGLGKSTVEDLAKLALGPDSPTPDLTLILDLAPETGLSRADERGGDEHRFEQLDRAFHERLREAFLEIAAGDPGRCVVVDAEPVPELVAANIWSVVTDRLGS